MEKPNSARVWDITIRLFHWTLVLAFTLAYITGEAESEIHAWAGYVILGLLVLTETLVHTGLVDAVGRWLVKTIGASVNTLQLMLLIVPAPGCRSFLFEMKISIDLI